MVLFLIKEDDVTIKKVLVTEWPSKKMVIFFTILGCYYTQINHDYITFFVLLLNGCFLSYFKDFKDDNEKIVL